jgi:hypothetical protein
VAKRAGVAGDQRRLHRCAKQQQRVEGTETTKPTRLETAVAGEWPHLRLKKVENGAERERR